MKIEIKHRFTGEVISYHEQENNFIKITAEKALTDGAYLGVAYLGVADLGVADLGVAHFGDLSDVPVIENIHRKVYEAASATGALDMGAWHTCSTTHCRAGWVVALAGEKGEDLE